MELAGIMKPTFTGKVNIAIKNEISAWEITNIFTHGTPYFTELDIINIFESSAHKAEQFSWSGS